MLFCDRDFTPVKPSKTNTSQHIPSPFNFLWSKFNWEPQVSCPKLSSQLKTNFLCKCNDSAVLTVVTSKSLFVHLICNNFFLFLQGDSFHKISVAAGCREGLSNRSVTRLLQHSDNTGRQKTPKTWETLKKRAGKSSSFASNEIHWRRASYLLRLNVLH